MGCHLEDLYHNSPEPGMCEHPVEVLHLTNTQWVYAQKVVLVTKKPKKEGRNVGCQHITNSEEM